MHPFLQSVPSPGPPPRVGRAGQMQLLKPRVPQSGLWLGQWSNVNPQRLHATRARGHLHGTPRAAAAPAMMLQRLAVLRRKGCHSIVVPRRRGRLAPLLRVRANTSGRTGLPRAKTTRRHRRGVAVLALGGLVEGQTLPGISIGLRLSGPW